MHTVKEWIIVTDSTQLRPKKAKLQFVTVINSSDIPAKIFISSRTEVCILRA